MPPGAVELRHHPEGYSWIDANDSANNVLSFMRYGSDGSVLACVFNFAGAEHRDYRLGLPRAGRWREVLNTDATIYHGSGIGNLGGVDATDDPGMAARRPRCWCCRPLRRCG